MVFIKDNIKNIVKYAISKFYEKLNTSDKEIIINYTVKILEIIYYLYNLDLNVLEYQLKQNNYKDIKWIFTLLLPYINESANPSELFSLKKLYSDKYFDVDINEKEPFYKYTNIQYGRCIHKKDGNKIIAQEIEFDIEHLNHNFYLLINSLIESSNKLYVNWIEILPLDLNSYNNTDLYKNTLQIFNENKLNEINIKDLINLNVDNSISGLYIGDIYNCIKTYLYDDIKNIKLLIFDLIIVNTDVLNPMAPAINVLGEIFNTKRGETLNYALQDISWDRLDKEHHQIFKQKYKSLTQSYINNQPYTVIIDDANKEHDITTYTISSLSIQRLMKGIAINFDKKNRNNKKILKSGYKKLNNELNEDDDDDEKLDGLDLDNLKECIASIDMELLYEFFRGLLQQFKYTYYGSCLLTPDKKSIDISRLKEYTYKNLYNFSKSLTHYESNKEYLEYNKHWKSLEKKEKDEILKRLNNKHDNILKWFNIQGYIRFLKLGEYDYYKYNNEYEVELKGDKRTRFNDIITRTVTQNVKYDMRDIYYNVIIYDRIREDLIRIIFDCLIKKGVLSTLTFNKQLSDTQYTHREIINDKLKYNIFLQSESNPFYTNSYYYLTEMPYKYSYLFEKNSVDSWYGMAALEWVSQIGFCHHYINNRVCFMTGGTGVGKSTHVPKLYAYYLKAIDYKSNGKVVCTQPRITPTKKTADTVSKQLGIPIYINKMVDGKETPEETDSYYMQLQYKGKKHVRNVSHLVIKIVTDGLLVQEIKNSKPLFKKEIKKKDDKQESMKFGENLYDVIIIDEAHEHNRNMDMILTIMRLYTYYNPSIRLVILSATIDSDEPTYRRYYRLINDNLKYPLDINLKESNIDRINVDRRYHISPPGATTRFSIKEFYHDEKTDIVQLTQQIIRGAKGNILVFQPGQKDIINLVEQLNKVIPATWITLPFYSELNDNKRTFIEYIDDRFKYLHINKDDDFNDLNTLFDTSKPSYTNFVLVATNIAEASITINSLYYVVDVGKRKNDYYDYEKKNSKILETLISESSRLQRKGRVGRVQPGEVHYLYKENALINNKTPVEFSIQNISESLYSLLRENHSEKEFIIDDYINDRITGQLFKTISGIYDYKGSQFIEDFISKMAKYYETGYSIDDLIDNNGSFYIIHPDDMEFTRNVIGKIQELNSNNIEFADRKLGIIKSKKILSYIEDYETYKYITNKIDFDKSDFGLLIQTINENFQFDNPAIGKILLNSILLDNENDGAIIAAALDVLKGDLKTLFVFNDITSSFELSKAKTKLDSDFHFIIELFKQFINYLNQRYVYFNLNKVIDEYINNSSVFNKTSIKSVIVNYDQTDEDNDRDNIIKNMLEYIEHQIITDSHQEYITKWCMVYNIDKKKIMRFILRYIKILDDIKKLYYPDKREKEYKSIIYKYKKEYIKYVSTKIDKLKIAFILSVPYNLCANITGTEQYLSLYNPNINNIYSIQKIRIFTEQGKKYISDTFIDLIYRSGYIIYFNFRNDMISGIIHIDKSYIKILSGIYNKERLERIVSPINIKIDKYLQKLDDNKKLEKERNIKIKTPDDYNIISKVGKIYKQIIADIDFD